MSERVNDDLHLWVNDLMSFAQQVRPSAVPLDAPPAPAFSRTRNVCSSGGDILRLVEGLQISRDSRDGASKGSQSLALAKTGPTRKKSAALCRLFASTGQYRYFDYKVVHAIPQPTRPLLQLSSMVGRRHQPGECEVARRRRLWWVAGSGAPPR